MLAPEESKRLIESLSGELDGATGPRRAAFHPETAVYLLAEPPHKGQARPAALFGVETRLQPDAVVPHFEEGRGAAILQ